MPEKWDDAREKKLLLAVISGANLTVERNAWAFIAVSMGGSVTAEACRQKFQSIKRGLKCLDDDPQPATTPSKAAKAAKPKTPTSASGTNAKARKRKAAEADLDLDADEEATLFTPKALKMKKEASAHGLGAEVFKAEEAGEGVDLENDDLYDDDDDAA